MTVGGSPSPFPLKAGSPLPFGEGSGEPAFKGKNINVTTVNGIWPTADEKHIPFCLKAICSDAEAHRVIENKPSVPIRHCNNPNNHRLPLLKLQKRVNVSHGPENHPLIVSGLIISHTMKRNVYRNHSPAWIS